MMSIMHQQPERPILCPICLHVFRTELDYRRHYCIFVKYKRRLSQIDRQSSHRQNGCVQGVCFMGMSSSADVQSSYRSSSFELLSLQNLWTQQFQKRLETVSRICLLILTQHCHNTLFNYEYNVSLPIVLSTRFAITFLRYS